MLLQKKVKMMLFPGGCQHGDVDKVGNQGCEPKVATMRSRQVSQDRPCLRANDLRAYLLDANGTMELLHHYISSE
jgi:hypothetical protein